MLTLWKQTVGDLISSIVIKEVQVRYHELTEQERKWVDQALDVLGVLSKDITKAEADERLTSAQVVALLAERRRIVELTAKLFGLINEEVHGNG